MRLAHVTFVVSPDNLRPALDALLAAAPVVRQMNGCKAFIPFADPTVEGGLGVLHEWSSGEEFASYLASPTYAAVNATLRPMMTQGPVGRRFDANPV